MLQLRYITVHHTCMLRESQTSTQVSLKFTTTHQHDSNITILYRKTIARNQTYHIQQSTSYQSKVLRACSQGDRLVGKDHRSSPTATHKEDNQRNTLCFKFVTQRLPYVHATGLANFNTSISQIHNYSTSTTLILLPPYLKTIIKHQTSLSIQNTHKNFFTNLEYLAYQDYLSKLPCYLRLSK